MSDHALPYSAIWRVPIRAAEFPPASAGPIAVILRDASAELERTVVVAVAAVHVMEVTVHQVVDMVSVGDGLVPAPGAVLVAGVVGPACVVGRAARRVRLTDREAVLVDVVRVGMMEMAIVQVVGMAVVVYGQMTAVLSVDM